MDVAVIGSGNLAITAVNDLIKYAKKIRKGCGVVKL
jgi:cation diffusion facilitator CzcD-associated flavoprotein CzcO